MEEFIDVDLAREYAANARILLEMGGKYTWCDELQQCDDLLKLVIEILDGNTTNVYDE